MKKLLLCLIVFISGYTSFSQSCVEPINLIATDITTNSVTIGWTQPQNPDATVASEWQIIALPCGSPPPTAATTGWLNSTTNPFVFTGLNSDTCYCFYVKSTCSITQNSNWSTSICRSTQQAPPVCGGTFTDNGGANGNYSNGLNQTTTICPTVPGDVVTVNFTYFSTQTNQDALYVFNGNSSTAALIASSNGVGNVPGGLAGGYWGNTTPGPFISTSPDGCLTFTFRSDATNNSSGWLANITCGPAGACIPIVSPAQLTFCDPAELPIYNLNDAVPQIINGQLNLIVTFFTTLADAQSNTNPLVSSPYFPTINPGQQILYVRVTNQNTQCFAFTTLTLNTENCNITCTPPIQLTASNVNQNSLQLNWGNNPAGNPSIIYFTFSVVPYGELPNINSSFTVIATQLNYTLTNLQNNFCYSIYIRKQCDIYSYSDWSLPLNVCTSNCDLNGTCADGLRFIAFLDSNNNGIKDPNENNFSNGNFVYQLNNSGNSIIGNSNNGNFYIFDSNVINLYDIQFTPYTNYYSSLNEYNDISIQANSGITTYYFPITVNQSFVDAGIGIYSLNNVVPGFTHTERFFYKNNSASTIPTGIITFTKDVNLTISGISQAGTNPTTTGFTYTFTNLLPLETRYIDVSFIVPTIPTVSLGQLVTNSVTINCPNDQNANNNSSSLTKTIVGSFDPNDIIESHGEQILYSAFTNSDYLYYTIQFENTGTANAQFVRVENTLDSRLDETSFELVYSNHNVNKIADVTNTNLKFMFYNINLPPTSLQPNNSHGYVVYKIKPKPGFAIGDIIPNTANIFFDYNPPIVTNTFNTEFVAALGNTNFTSTDFILYPNPAKETVTILLPNSSELIDEIIIYDMLGKAVKTISTINNQQMTTSVSELAKGIYILEMETTNHLKISKKLVIQ